MKNNNPVIFFRADASKAIGMGHLNRAYLIAGMLQSRFGLSSKVIMRRDELGEGFARKRQLDVVVFDAKTLHEEISFLVNLARQESPRIFFLDVLEHDTNRQYTQSFRQSATALIAITDDSFRRVIDADFIINGNPAQIGQDYSQEQGKYLLGPKYFVMDEVYAGAHDQSPKKEVPRVLITLGASDHNDLLFKLLLAIKEIKTDFKMILIVSSACGYLDRLKDFLRSFPKRYELVIDAPSLFGYWKLADLAITAGGNTLFERIAARVPGVTLCQLRRQNEIAQSFQALGVNCNLGYGPELSVDQIKSGIENFLNDHKSHQMQYEKSQEQVDGKGLSRLGDVLELLLKGVNL